VLLGILSLDVDECLRGVHAVRAILRLDIGKIGQA
jgi:hypothetical protein